MVCIQGFWEVGRSEVRTEPASDASLEGNASSPPTLLKQPEDKLRTGRCESDGSPKTISNSISCHGTADGLPLIYKDDGVGIPLEKKKDSLYGGRLSNRFFPVLCPMTFSRSPTWRSRRPVSRKKVYGLKFLSPRDSAWLTGIVTIIHNFPLIRYAGKNTTHNYFP